MLFKKWFIRNFVISLLGYIASIIFGFLVFGIRQFATWTSEFNINDPEVVPLWVEIVLGGGVLIILIGYFFLGTRLKLLNNHLLNYLSVCGFSVFALCMVWWIPYMAIFVNMPFLNFGILMGRYINFIVSTSILAIIPSIMIWLGMLYQTKKNNGVEVIS